MGSQAGAQGRRASGTKVPVAEDQGERVPARAVTTAEEKRDQQHTQDTRYLPKPKSVDTPIRTESASTSSVQDFRNVSHEPPVTKTTLSELDVPRIIFNPKLRHDVNFDPDLHFRPNLDGEKGRRKAQKQSEFWDCLRAQLEAFMKDQSKFMADLGGRQWCLPLTLHAIGEILATLVPPEDRSVVESILNVDLLMQQFSKGVADLEKLALWLSRTLKSHCAPMRDEWVDEMVKQLSDGNLYQDITLLVRGLQTLLAILESMKLDVANHQIRCLRPLLIQDTVEFEQTYFMKKIATRKIDVIGAYQFFKAAQHIQDHPASQSRLSQGDMWVFFKGFANILRPSKMAFKAPDTFVFDEERIVKLRSAVLDAVNLDVCMRLFQNELQRSNNLLSTPSTAPSTPSLLYDSSPCSSRSISPISRSQLSSPSLIPIPDLDDAFSGSKIRKDAAPSPRSNLSEDSMSMTDDDFEEQEHHSLSNSARLLPSMSTPMTVSQSWDTPLEISESSIRQSILALIDDTVGDNRWQHSCGAISLQILRSTRSLNSFDSFESKLRFHLGNFTSDVFQTSEVSVLADLYPLLDALVNQYSQLSSTQLFEIASIPQKIPADPSSRPIALRDVAKQVAHIGILHWRVWAPLVYLVNPDADDTAVYAAEGPTTGGTGTQADIPDRQSRTEANGQPLQISDLQNIVH